MSPNFATTKLLLSESCWLSSEDLTEQIAPPSIKAALQLNGLLTSALQEAYGASVSVECVRQSEWADDQRVLGLQRDVLLKVDDAPCVAASTLMPSNVINIHPWLAGLGNRPLGEMLEARVRHQRGAYEFAQIDANLVFQNTPGIVQSPWARRYRFSLEGGDLLVMEIFYPGVLDRLTVVGTNHKG